MRIVSMLFLSMIAGATLSGEVSMAAHPSKKPASSPAVAVAKGALKEISITSKSPNAIEVFKKGRELAEDLRIAEALEQFNKAIELDGDFAQAHAYLGSLTPGAAGHKHLERANTLAEKLPEAERMSVHILVAVSAGDEGKARNLRSKLAELAPGDWRAQFGLGAMLSGERKWDGAIAALKKASNLNPKAGSVFNTMGYTYLAMGKSDQAVEAFRNYVALRPGEPNPQDSLAEALMAAGHLDESEAAFKKALELSPQFWFAWEGIAQARFLRGDWSGGRAMLAKAKEAATRPIDKLDPDGLLAWSQAAEGDEAAALKTFETIEGTAKAQNLDVIEAFGPLNRALLLNDMDKPEKAMALTEEAVEKGKKVGLPGGEMNALRRQALVLRIESEALLGRSEQLKATLAKFEEEAKKVPDNAFLKSRLHFGRGEEAASRGDSKAAAEHFSKCINEDYQCRFHLIKAQQKAGDKAGAEASRNQLMNANRRDPQYLYFRARLSEKDNEKDKKKK